MICIVYYWHLSRCLVYRCTAVSPAGGDDVMAAAWSRDPCTFRMYPVDPGLCVHIYHTEALFYRYILNVLAANRHTFDLDPHHHHHHQQPSRRQFSQASLYNDSPAAESSWQHCCFVYLKSKPMLSVLLSSLLKYTSPPRQMASN